MLLIQPRQDKLDSAPPALGVVRRQRTPRKDAAPELAGDDVQVALDTDELAFRLLQHLVGAQAGIELQLKLAGKFLLAEAPVPLGAGQQVLLEPFLIVS